MTTLLAAVAAALVAAAAGFAAGRRRLPEVPAPTAPDSDWLVTLLRGMDEGVVAFDPGGRVAFANPSAARLLGRVELPVGTPLAAFADVPRLRSTVVIAMREGRPTSRELEVPGPPRRVVQLRVTPGAHGAVAVLLDVTEVRRIERGWREFAATTSHELRTPVAAVLANLELLDAAWGVPGADPAPLVGAARRQAERLAALVSDLLDLVRIESRGAVAPSSLEPVLLAGVLARAVEEVGAGGDVRVAPTSLAVRGDEWMLARVFANLVSNGVRHGGGTVHVTAGSLGDRVWVRVADDGPGIPPAHRERVFDRFYRVDEGRSRAAGGTGLGLAIVKEMVENLGGTVRLEDDGPGAVFVVELAGAALPTPEPRPPRETR